MKILFVLSEYLPDSGGGIISYYAGILPHLVRAGHEVEVLLARPDALDMVDRTIEGVRIRYLQSSFLREASRGFDRYRVGYPTCTAFLPLAWAAWEQARHGEGFDLVETTDFPLLFAPWVVAMDGPPVNISLHGSCGQLEWHEHPSLRAMDGDLVRMIERAAFSSAQAIQANSQSNARFWQELTHRPVQVLLPSFADDGKREVVSSRRPEGVVAGRLQIWKGPHVMCQALENVPEARVRWIGRDVADETGEPISQTLRARYPHIFGTQLRHEQGVTHAQILREIAGASFLCVPSLWDAFNLTAVEAMMLGTPVLCSRQAGASMLIQDGENGFLFDPAKPEGLADAIQQVLSLTEAERMKLTTAAKRTVQEKMDPVELCRERVAYYQSLLASQTPKFDDEWLRATLAPLSPGTERAKMLRAFTAKELIAAAGRQMVSGLKRRMP